MYTITSRRAVHFMAAVLCGLCITTRAAVAENASAAGQASTTGHAAASEHTKSIGSTANLDGVYIILAPVASAVHTRDNWDSAFGGELSVVRVRERKHLGALGLGIGGIHFTEVDRGRVWADVQLGSRWPLGLGAGLGAGVSAELDAVIPPRWGAQATFWVFVGVIPYIRVGTVQQSGAYIDLGLKIPLPVFRL